MLIKNLVDEDFVNYYRTSMFIGTSTCSWKCGKNLCQNSELAQAPQLNIPDCGIVQRYLSNSLTSAVVIGGLEPFDQWEELRHLVDEFRRYTTDTIVIYTGYTEEESKEWVKVLRTYPNIVIKFGRFVPNCEPHFDKVLGIKLASPNQYARKIS